MDGQRDRYGTTWREEENTGECPTCGVIFTGASAIDQMHDHPPKVDDVTVCMYCTSVSRFTGHGLQQRKVGGDELKEILADDDIIKAVLAARLFSEKYPALVAERLAAASSRKFLRSLEGHLDGKRTAGGQAAPADVHDLPGAADPDRPEGSSPITD